MIKLEHKVEVKTNEEDEDVQFKMYVLLFFCLHDDFFPANSCIVVRNSSVSIKSRRNGRNVARAMCVS